MNTLAPLLTLDSVKIGCDAVSRKRLFEEAALIFERTCGVAHQDSFDALFNREKIGSTCVGHGCAIPHGRIEGLEEPALAILRTLEPIKLDAPDNEPVSLFFCLLIPENDTENYLNVLREIALCLKDDAFRERLMRANSEVAICEIIHSWENPSPQE